MPYITSFTPLRRVKPAELILIGSQSGVTGSSLQIVGLRKDTSDQKPNLVE